jgi:hypothetical protein
LKLPQQLLSVVVELRQSNTLADAFSNILRKTFNGNTYFPNDISEDESEK